MKKVFLSVALLGVLISSSCTTKSKKQKMNVIYILADDLGYGDLGCYGQKIIKTPNIDRLAEEGMLFTQHYSGCTVSAPSRSCLMTGQHTGHTYIRGNQSHGTEGEEPLPGNTYTLARMMKDAGYATGAFGKWGLGYPCSEGDPTNLGFDEFFGYNCQRQAHHYYPYHLWHNQEKVMLPGNEGSKTETYAQDLIQEKALQFIVDNQTKPFFLYLPYILPHAELVSPEDSILAMYKGKIEEGKPYEGVDDIKNPYYKYGGYCSSENPHADFASMVTRFDAYVGEIMQTLKRLGLDKNTIVFFASDNGPHQEGGADPDFFNSYGPFRGIKRDMYEGGIRVPLIAWAPGKVEAGTCSDHISAFWDVMPTLADIAGGEIKGECDGISFAPTLFGGKGQKQHEYLYWEFHERGGRVAVRMGNWKGVKLNFGKNPQAPMQLFNLENDVHEDCDVSEQHPDIVEQMEIFIKQAHVKSDLFPYPFEK